MKQTPYRLCKDSPKTSQRLYKDSTETAKRVHRLFRDSTKILQRLTRDFAQILQITYRDPAEIPSYSNPSASPETPQRFSRGLTSLRTRIRRYTPQFDIMRLRASCCDKASKKTARSPLSGIRPTWATSVFRQKHSEDDLRKRIQRYTPHLHNRLATLCSLGPFFILGGAPHHPK